MALDPVRLSDVTWDDLVTLARRRIVAVSRGEWTLHAPVDPGITFLELFASILEQRAYWLDQTPDSLVRALLAMLGIAPRGAVPASTVLSVAADAQRIATSGTPFSITGTVGGGSPIVFTTDHDVTLLPVTAVTVETEGRDRAADLAQGRFVRLLRADRTDDEARIVITSKSKPSPSSAPIGVLLDLVVPPSIAPDWVRDASLTIPKPADVRYLHRRSDGSLVEFTNVDDGTGGLRRSGVLRLAIPDDWAPEPGTTDRYAIVVQCAERTFTVPPRLARLAANAVVARHRRTVQLTHRTSWLPLAGVKIALEPWMPPPLAETVRVHLRERAASTRWSAWMPIADLGAQGPDARVFVVDRAGRSVSFGDGLTGRQPVLANDDVLVDLPWGGAADASAPNVAITYVAGGGSGANVGADLEWIEEAEVAPLSAHSPVAATGGTEDEPLADARERAAAELRAHRRAVTAPDHVELATGTPGVAIRRAHAAVGFHPDHPCDAVPGAITVFVVPYAPRDEDHDDGSDHDDVRWPVADPGALAAVQSVLDRARLAGSEVFVRSARYRHARVEIVAEGDPRDPRAIEARIASAITRFADPLVGGDDGDGWPFGEPLRPSSLIRVAQRAAEKDATIRAVRIGLDDEPIAEVCGDRGIGAHRLLAIDAVRVRFERAPFVGGLR